MNKQKITVAIHGLGSIGTSVLDCLQHTSDMECLGSIRRQPTRGALGEFSSIETLVAAKGRPDVIVLAAPSRAVPELAVSYLKQGFNTVDSFDIHSEIATLVQNLDSVAQQNKAVAISSAGWDPGTDSVFRAYFTAMVPIGSTFTNFGRGRSMGHSVAAKNIAGVHDAIAITIPLGGGRHSRLVYVVLEQGVTLEAVSKALQADSYFSSDPLEVCAVTQEQLPFMADSSHGVLMERLGASGSANNQRLSFDMRINNPALTAQVLVGAARASTRLAAGSYTLIDIPPVALLPGERLHWVHSLV